DLLQTVRIAGNYRARIDDLCQTDIFRFGGRTDRFDRHFDDRAQIDRADVEPQFSARDARYVENVFDQLRLSFGVSLDRFDGAPLMPVVDLSFPEQTRPAEYRRKRR